MPVNLSRIAILLLGMYPAAPCLAARDDAPPKAVLPAVDREWFGDDYVRAAEALTSGDASLPRVSEPGGAELLRRLTSEENLSFYRNKSAPIPNRLDNYLKMMDSVKRILLGYLVAANEGEDVHEETARVMAFTLKVGAVGLELIEEFLPTIPRDDTYDVRMEGLKKMKSGLTSMFVGAEISLSERDFYSAEDLSLLLDAMASTLPVMKRAFSPNYPAELGERLKSHRRSFAGEKDRKNIDRMLDELGAT